MSEEDQTPRYEANPAGPFWVLFVASFSAFLAAIFLRMLLFEGLSMIPVAAFAIGAATSLFWIFRLTDKRTKRVRNEGRFGANGAVLNEMSDALRQDYERASFDDTTGTCQHSYLSASSWRSRQSARRPNPRPPVCCRGGCRLGGSCLPWPSPCCRRCSFRCCGSSARVDQVRRCRQRGRRGPA